MKVIVESKPVRGLPSIFKIKKGNDMGYIDLHTHTAKSDGTYTPKELVDYGVKKGLKAIAITDHDTIDGVAEAVHAAKNKEIEIIAGIECSAECMGKEIHLVGLFINIEDSRFLAELKHLRQVRENRNNKMIKLLSENNITVELEKLKERFPNSILTRMHFAKYLMEKGYVSDIQAAFDRYLGDKACCYVKKEQPQSKDIITMIKNNGGVPVLAHPLLYHLSEVKLETMIRYLTECGLLGIEVIYSTHTARNESYLYSLAERYGLAVSGGSDFHGTNKRNIDLGSGRGNLRVPEEILLPIRRLAE